MNDEVAQGTTQRIQLKTSILNNKIYANRRKYVSNLRRINNHNSQNYLLSQSFKATKDSVFSIIRCFSLELL